MKNVAYFLSIVFLFSALAPAAMAVPYEKDKNDVELTPEEEARLDEINTRIEEIREINFSQLSKEERKELRKELRDINKEAKAVGGGVYISVGAIIIILLLILLLR